MGEDNNSGEPNGFAGHRQDPAREGGSLDSVQGGRYLRFFNEEGVPEVKIKIRFALPSAALLACLAAPAAFALDDAAVLEVYKAKCFACHLADGNAPMKEMNLADAEWKHGSKVADIIKTIEEGAPGTAMLSFKAQLSPEEIQGLADEDELRGLGAEDPLHGPEDDELRGLADDDDLRGIGDDDVQGFADEDLQGIDGYIRQDGVSGLEAFVPDAPRETPWFKPPAQSPPLWSPIW